MATVGAFYVGRTARRSPQTASGIALNGRLGVRGSARAAYHRLRHSFCSHPAMRGEPARAIQELAGQDAALHAPSPAALAGVFRRGAGIVETFWRRRMVSPLSPINSVT